MDHIQKVMTIHQCVTLQACYGIHSCISRDKCMRQIGLDFEQNSKYAERLKKEKGDE